eukprot:gene5346-3844_t
MPRALTHSRTTLAVSAGIEYSPERYQKMLDVSVTRISSNCALSSVYHHMQPQDHLASPSLTDPAPSQRLSLRVVHDSISLRHCEAFRPVSFPRIPSSNTAIGSSSETKQERRKEKKHLWLTRKRDEKGGLANVREPVQLSVSLRTSWSDQILPYEVVYVVIHLTARVDKAYATGSHTLSHDTGGKRGHRVQPGALPWKGNASEKMLDVSVTRISSNCALSSVYHHMQPQDHLASPSLTDPAPSQRLSLRVVHDSISLRHCEAFRPVSFPRIPSSNTAIGSSSETKQERRKEKKHLWLTRKRDEKGVLANVREPVQLSVSLRTSWSDQILPYEVVYVVIHLTARVDKAYATGSHTLSHDTGALPCLIVLLLQMERECIRKMLDVSVTRISSNCALSSVYHHMQPQDHLASPSLTDPAPSQRLSLRVVHDSISVRAPAHKN